MGWRPLGEPPFYEFAFTDASNSLGQTPGDQILLIEFEPNTLSNGGATIAADASSTLFNLFDNGGPQSYLQGGQANAHTLDYWLALYPTLSGDALNQIRIGIGLSCGCNYQSCSESLTVYSLDVEQTPTTAATPEPGTVSLLGTGLAGLAARLVNRRRNRRA